MNLCQTPTLKLITTTQGLQRLPSATWACRAPSDPPSRPAAPESVSPSASPPRWAWRGGSCKGESLRQAALARPHPERANTKRDRTAGEGGGGVNAAASGLPPLFKRQPYLPANLPFRRSPNIPPSTSTSIPECSPTPQEIVWGTFALHHDLCRRFLSFLTGG